MTLIHAPRRWSSGVAASLAAVVLLATGAGASQESPSGLPTGDVQVEGQQTPILGTFAYHQGRDDSRPEIRGLVHGVRRVDGGTVLYYSIGAASGSGSAFAGANAFPDSSNPYALGRGVDLRLVDSVGLSAYRPLYDQDTTFASATRDLGSDYGDLRVGFAVFPELPPEVETVQVVMPFGTAVGDVAVEDGALEPVGDDPAPLLGEGWPAIPSAADLRDVDQADRTYTLVRRSGDAHGTTQTEESPEQVSTTLDANVLFAVDSADVSAEAAQALASVADDIRDRGVGEVVVTGHTDSDGAAAYNQNLSEARAASVLAVLAAQGGPDVTFVAVGRGQSDPVAGNDTDQGKQQNRRVTVVYSIQGES